VSSVSVTVSRYAPSPKPIKMPTLVFGQSRGRLDRHICCSLRSTRSLAMRVPAQVLVFGASLVLVIPEAAQAGMPSVTLNDTARLRLHTVSFFLAAFLLSSWAVKLLWNYLGKDFA